MILDKFGDFLYEHASRLFSAWRVGCFLVTCLVVSDAAFGVLELTFWTSGLSDSVAKLVSGFLGLPTYFVLLVAFLSFIVSPLLSKTLVLMIMRREISRAQKAMEDIGLNASSLGRDLALESLIAVKDKAIKGEGRIAYLKGLNESLVYAVIFGLYCVLRGEAREFYYSVLMVTPLLFYFSVQEMLSVYLKSIYFYKALAERLSRD